MAIGRHWEWRGFGSVSDAFFERYRDLAYAFGPQKIDDLYVWAPGLQVNLKIRQGAFEGLKIKRPSGKEGRFECWIERPEDFYDLPLTEFAWQALAVELAGAGLVLGPYPNNPPGLEDLLFLLEGAGCESLLVSKERGGRWWEGPNGRVLVEWTAIHQPQAILSLSLESQDTNPESSDFSDHKAKADLQAAILALGLDRESLALMNFLHALAIWIDGRRISSQ
jgi:hypothetical protein